MDYLPLYLAAFGITILSLVGWGWWHNEKLKRSLVQRVVEMLDAGATSQHVIEQLLRDNLQPDQAAAILNLANISRHRQAAIDLVNEGKADDEVIIFLTKRGIDTESAQSIVAGAQFHLFCQRHPILSITLGILMPLLGIALMLAGLGLWMGNQSGLFVTFPYAGHFTIGIGLTIFIGGVAFLRATLRSR